MMRVMIPSIYAAYDASILYYRSICHFLRLSLPMMPLFCFNWAYVIFATTPLLTECHHWLNFHSEIVIFTAYDASILLQLSICDFLWFLLPMMPLFCCNWAYVIFSASIQVKLSICNDEFFELSLLLNLAHCPILLSTTTTVLLLMVLAGCCSLLLLALY